VSQLNNFSHAYNNILTVIIILLPRRTSLVHFFEKRKQPKKRMIVPFFLFDTCTISFPNFYIFFHQIPYFLIAYTPDDCGCYLHHHFFLFLHIIWDGYCFSSKCDMIWYARFFFAYFSNVLCTLCF